MKNLQTNSTIATDVSGHQLDIFSDYEEAPKEVATHLTEMPKIVPTIRTNCVPDATLKHQNMTLVQYIYDNLRVMNAENGWSEYHYIDQQKKLKKFCEFQNYGLRLISEITPRDIQSYLMFLEDKGDIRRGKGLAPNSINRHCACISGLFKYAHTNGDIDVFPTFKWRRVEEGRIRTFSSEEIQNLLDFFQNDEHYGKKYPWIRDMMIVGLYTGMRLGEIKMIGSIVTLESDDEGDFLRIPAGKDKARSKKDRFISIDRPELLDAIKKLGNVSSYYSHYAFTSAWKKAKRKFAPDEKHFCSHILRHTCASYLANEQKANMEVIADYLGHRALATTRKYIHVSRKAKSEAQKSMDYGVAI